MTGVLLIVTAFFTALLSGIFGMAGGLVLMGALALMLPVSAAFVTHGLLQLVANGWRSVLHRQHVSWSIVGWYALASLVAGIVVSLVAFAPSKPLLFLLLGLVPLLVWLPRKWIRLDAARPPHALISGLMVTGLNLTAGVAGPLLDIFFVRTDLNRHQIVATKATTQVFSHLAKIAVYGMPLLAAGRKGMPPLWVFAFAVPLSMLGTVCGGWVLDRISDVNFKRWTAWIVTGVGALPGEGGTVVVTKMPTLGQACVAVLETADPHAKAFAARKVARDWRLGRLAFGFDAKVPERPARPNAPELLPPNRMPKRGKGGSERARIAMLHALAHIEFVAIDLAFDLVARFGGEFPEAFAADWLKVGADEAMHFALLDRRLKQLGSFYGALPAHDGLWEAASETAHDATARLAIVPLVLEARALDITPQTIERFLAAGDETTAKSLTRIMRDEVNHVHAGTKWFLWAMNRVGQNPQKTYQKLVRQHFRGSLKQPFNDSARDEAGLTRDWYEALAR